MYIIINTFEIKDSIRRKIPKYMYKGNYIYFFKLENGVCTRSAKVCVYVRCIKVKIKVPTQAQVFVNRKRI